MNFKYTLFFLLFFASANIWPQQCYKSAHQFSKLERWQGRYPSFEYKKLHRAKILLKSLLGDRPELYAEKLNTQAFDHFLGKVQNQVKIIEMAKILGTFPDNIMAKYFKYSEIHLDTLYHYLKSGDQWYFSKIKQGLNINDEELIILLMQSFPLSLREIAENTSLIERITKAFRISPELLIRGMVREGENFIKLKAAVDSIDDAPVAIPFRHRILRDLIASTKLMGMMLSGTLSYTFIRAPQNFSKELRHLLNLKVPRGQKSEMLFNYFRKMPFNIMQNYFRLLMKNMVIERVADPKITNGILNSVILDSIFLFFSHLAKNGWANLNDLVVSNLNFAFLEVAMWMLEGSAHKKILAQTTPTAKPDLEQKPLRALQLATRAMQEAIMSVPPILKETVAEAPLRFVSIAPLNLMGLASSRLLVEAGMPLSDNLTKIAIDFLYTQLFLTFWSAPRLKGLYRTFHWLEEHTGLNHDHKAYKGLSFSLIAGNIAIGASTYIYARDWFYNVINQDDQSSQGPKNPSE